MTNSDVIRSLMYWFHQQYGGTSDKGSPIKFDSTKYSTWVSPRIEMIQGEPHRNNTSTTNNPSDLTFVVECWSRETDVPMPAMELASTIEAILRHAHVDVSDTTDSPTYPKVGYCDLLEPETKEFTDNMGEDTVSVAVVRVKGQVREI